MAPLRESGTKVVNFCCQGIRSLIVLLLQCCQPDFKQGLKVLILRMSDKLAVLMPSGCFGFKTAEINMEAQNDSAEYCGQSSNIHQNKCYVMQILDVCTHQLLSVLLQSDRIYERYKYRLRLQDASVLGGSSVGMYPGLITLLQDQQLSVEFITMLLDQILSTGLLI